MSKLRFSGIKFRWKLEIECWILDVQTLKFLNVDLTGYRRNSWVQQLKVGSVLRNAPRTATESRPYPYHEKYNSYTIKVTRDTIPR